MACAVLFCLGGSILTGKERKGEPVVSRALVLGALLCSGTEHSPLPAGGGGGPWAFGRVGAGHRPSGRPPTHGIVRQLCSGAEQGRDQAGRRGQVRESH